jgi:hypothetical protein
MSNGVFDDRGTRQYAMSGYTGHKKSILNDDDHIASVPESSGKIPGKYY